jgi:transcription elongation factor Elf1
VEDPPTPAPPVAANGVPAELDVRRPAGRAHACRRCGSTDVRVDERDDPDKPIGLACQTCGAYTWPPKPGNENRRRDRNPKHRKQWRQRLRGVLVCAWCGVTEQQTRAGFEVDHVEALEHGGADTFENTWVLCRNCHTRRHADRCTVAHLLGRSAREATG